MSLTYAQIRELQKRLGVDDISTRKFSRLANEGMQTDMFDQGDTNLLGRAIKSFSYNIDKALDWSGATEAAGNVGYDLFGSTGEEFFRGIPRMAVDLTPAAIGGPLGLTASAFMAGSNVYEKTGSPAAGAVMGIGTLALPAVMNKAGQSVLGRMGATKADAVALRPGNADIWTRTVLPGESKSGATFLNPFAHYVAQKPAEKVAKFVTEQTTGVAWTMGQDAATSVITGQNPFDLFKEPAYWMAQTLGFAPFAIRDGFNAMKTDPLARYIGWHKTTEELRNRSVLVDKPYSDTPTNQAQKDLFKAERQRKEDERIAEHHKYALAPLVDVKGLSDGLTPASLDAINEFKRLRAQSRMSMANARPLPEFPKELHARIAAINDFISGKADALDKLEVIVDQAPEALPKIVADQKVVTESGLPATETQRRIDNIAQRRVDETLKQKALDDQSEQPPDAVDDITSTLPGTEDTSETIDVKDQLVEPKEPAKKGRKKIDDWHIIGPRVQELDNKARAGDKDAKTAIEAAENAIKKFGGTSKRDKESQTDYSQYVWRTLTNMLADGTFEIQLFKNKIRSAGYKQRSQQEDLSRPVGSIKSLKPDGTPVFGKEGTNLRLTMEQRRQLEANNDPLVSGFFYKFTKKGDMYVGRAYHISEKSLDATTKEGADVYNLVPDQKATIDVEEFGGSDADVAEDIVHQQASSSRLVSVSEAKNVAVESPSDTLALRSLDEIVDHDISVNTLQTEYGMSATKAGRFNKWLREAFNLAKQGAFQELQNRVMNTWKMSSADRKEFQSLMMEIMQARNSEARDFGGQDFGEVRRSLYELHTKDLGPDELTKLNETLTHLESLWADKDPGRNFSKVLLLAQMLKNSGLTDPEVAAKLPTLVRLFNVTNTIGNVDLLPFAGTDMSRFGFFSQTGTRARIWTKAAQKSGGFLSFVLAHEAVGHGLWTAHKLGQLTGRLKKHVDDFETFLRTSDEGLLKQTLNDLMDLAGDEIKSDVELRDIVLRDLDIEETHANITALLALQFTNKQHVSSIMDFMPKAVSDFVRAIAHWSVDIVNGLLGTQFLIKNKFLDGVSDPKMREALKEYSEGVQHVLKKEGELELMYTRMAQAGLLEPESIGHIIGTGEASTNLNWHLQQEGLTSYKTFLESVGLTPAMRRKGEIAKEGVVDFFAGIRYWFAPMAQYGARFKEMRDVFQLGAAREEVSNGIINAVENLYGFIQQTSGRVVAGSEQSPVVRYFDDAAVQEAYTKAQNILQENINEHPEIPLRDLYEDGQPDLIKVLDKLTPEQRELLFEVSDTQTRVQKFSVLQTRITQYHTVKELVTRLLMSSNKQLRYSTAKLQAEALVRPFEEAFGALHDIPRGALNMHTVSKTEIADVIQNIVKPLEAQMDQKSPLYTAIKFLPHAIQTIEDLAIEHWSRPHYISEQRFGKYKIEYNYLNKKGEIRRGWRSAETKEEAYFIRDELLDKNPKNTVKIHERDYRELTPDPFKSKFFELLDEHTERLRETLENNPDIPTDLHQTILNAFDMRSAMMNEFAALDIITNKAKRGFAAGREHLDYVQQQYVAQRLLARALSFRLTEAKKLAMQYDPTIRDNEHVQKALDDNWKNYKQPDTALMRAVSRFGFLWTIGLDLGNKLLELSQPLLFLPHKLVDEAGHLGFHHGTIASYRDVFKAYDDMTAYWTKGSSGDRELDDMIQKSLKEGLGGGMFEDIEKYDMLHKFDMRRRLMMGESAKSKTDLLKSPFYYISSMATGMQKISTSVSELNARVAAYRLYRKSGLSEADAYKQAKLFATEVMFTQGRYDRPSGIYSLDKGRPLSAAVMSLQKFTMSTIFGTVALYQRALDKGLSPIAQRSAKRAALTATLSQLAITGVIGYPFIGAVITGLEKMFDVNIREDLLSLSNEFEERDQEFLGMLSELGMHGFSRILGGPDISSRMGFSSLLGANAYTGFDLKNLLGPVGSNVAEMGEGISKIARGDMSGVQGFLPVPIRRVVKMAQDDWDFRDGKGRNLIDNPEPEQIGAFLLGFQPAELNKQKELANVQRITSERERAASNLEMQKLADMMQEGYIGTVKQHLRNKALGDPAFSYQAGASKIVDIIENQEFPVDYRQEPSRSEAITARRLQEAYGVSAPPPSEEARLMFRAQLLQKLGAPVSLTPRQVDIARKMDALLRQNPFMTSAEARMIVTRTATNEARRLGPQLF